MRHPRLLQFLLLELLDLLLRGPKVDIESLKAKFVQLLIGIDRLSSSLESLFVLLLKSAIPILLLILKLTLISLSILFLPLLS